MDPTMQSPVRRTIPLPFSEGVEITIPSGPHFYPVKNWVGSISQGNTAQQAFEALQRHALNRCRTGHFHRRSSVDVEAIVGNIVAHDKQRLPASRVTVSLFLRLTIGAGNAEDV